MGLAFAVVLESELKLHGASESDRKLARALVYLPASASNEAPAPASDSKPAAASPNAVVRVGAVQVDGRLSQEVVRKVVQDKEPQIRWCYEQVLPKKPHLSGSVVVKFVIDRSGAVSSVGDGGSSMDGDVVACEQQIFRGLRFPEPQGGIVLVVFPMTFAPK